MAAQPKHNTLSEAVREAMDGVDPSRGQRTAFDLARALQGVIARFGLKSGFPECRDVVRDFAEENGLDPEDFESEVFLVWNSVVCPEGIDPVTAAALTAKTEPVPKDFLPHVPGKARRLCWAAFVVARQLSGNGERTFFVSVRKLGEALGTDHMTAARALGILCNEGYLGRVGKVTRTRAQRYKFCYRGTEIQRNI